MEATKLTQGKKERLLDQSLDAMTNTYMFKFFMEGLIPQEATLILI